MTHLQRDLPGAEGFGLGVGNVGAGGGCGPGHSESDWLAVGPDLEAALAADASAV